MEKRFEISKKSNFNIEQIFDCGQCFRFNRVKEKEGVVCYEGVAFDKYIKLEQQNDRIIFYNTNLDEYNSIWHKFFDSDTNYEKISSEFHNDETLKKAYEYSSGIRILKQDRWEALCSFIISQNNNIPRIKGIIENMSQRFGKEIYRENERAYYSFPTATALYEAGIDEIFALKTGFRARYIYDAAKTVCENPGFLDEVDKLCTPEAIDKLCSIKGVGNKVAACTLLFGFSRYDAFPVDVWVKRILDKYYPNGANAHLTGKYAGIAQQYLFYYERCMNNVFI